MGRFDYVKYDEHAQQEQQTAKECVEHLESYINSIGSELPKDQTTERAKALAITNLEQVYMWIGKAIRDNQILRNARAELQEERTNS